MSGTANIKEGIEKAMAKSKPKLEQSDMFGSESVGNPAIQKDGKKEIQLSGSLDIQQNGKMENNPSIHTPRNLTTQKPQTYKMTFNFTEDVFKAFNDLYARRMLQGRKTDKSDMICEAVRLLVLSDSN